MGTFSVDHLLLRIVRTLVFYKTRRIFPPAGAILRRAPTGARPYWKLEHAHVSARNVILAVVGLAIVAGGAAYFMMKGANEPEAAATDETSAAVEDSVDASAGAAVDETGSYSEGAGIEDATEVGEAAETPDSTGEIVDELNADAGEETADDLEGGAAEFINDGSEEIDETLDEIPETPEETADEPSN
jgi:hypothetical protein